MHNPLPCETSDENRRWLRTFENTHGRPLRVLHIGNIANNAYNNAKIQRQRGVDADVLSFDYYHIMACPEWEDAAFSGDVRDDFFPDWWNVNLNGFRRPDWFVAGPLDPCIRYLLAKTANSRSAKWLWRILTLERWLLCRQGKIPGLVHGVIRRLTGRSVAYQTISANALLMTVLGTKLEAASRHRFIRDTRAGRWLRQRAGRLRRFGRTADMANDAARHLRMMRRNVADVERRGQTLFTEIGRQDFPGELESFYLSWWHPCLSLLFRRYDVVQCYATYTAMPFVAGLADYVAYEHGTLRAIPFQPTREGRMCMASYRAASSVLITNLDNLHAAEQMRLDTRRVTCLPHAFDSDKLVRFATSSGVRISCAHNTLIFVMSARQHWTDGDPGWAKGNDRVFAALRLLKDRGRSCLLRAVAWGNDLEASRARIAELGIGDMVQWLPTMKKRELWLEYLNAHAVIDQFVVPAFGGVTFEAMMLGRRVITYLDQARAERFFGVAPPLFSARTAEEIAGAMNRVIDDPSDSAGDGRANQEWMKRFHSADRIVDLQLSIYRRLAEQSDRRKQDRCAASTDPKCEPPMKP